MESILVKEDFSTVENCIDWTNSLIGEKVPEYDNYFAVKVEQFQIIMHSDESYTIIVLLHVVGALA